MKCAQAKNIMISFFQHETDRIQVLVEFRQFAMYVINAIIQVDSLYHREQFEVKR